MKFNKFHLIVFAALLIFAACSESKNNENEQNGDQDHYSDSDATEVPDEDESGETVKNPDFEDLECGISFGDYACDFTLPLDSGEWNFAENYSKDDNYLFVFYRSKNRTSTQIWQTRLYGLFDKDPGNIHIFFLVDTNDAELAKEKIQLIKDSVDDAMYMVDNHDILKRIHYVSQPISEKEGWITDWLKNNSDFFFGIDRFRRAGKAQVLVLFNHGADDEGLDPLFLYLALYVAVHIHALCGRDVPRCDGFSALRELREPRYLEIPVEYQPYYFSIR